MEKIKKYFDCEVEEMKNFPGVYICSGIEKFILKKIQEQEIPISDVLSSSNINRYLSESERVVIDDENYIKYPHLESINDKINKKNYFKLIRELLTQLNKIHKLGIIHMDIKSDNILFDPISETFNIIDFDASLYNPDYNCLNHIITFTSSFPAQSFFYRPIECFDVDDYFDDDFKDHYSRTRVYEGFDYEATIQHDYAFRTHITAKSDIYAMGVLIFELFDEYLTESEREFVYKMVNQDLGQRLNSDQIVEWTKLNK